MEEGGHAAPPQCGRTKSACGHVAWAGRNECQVKGVQLPSSEGTQMWSKQRATTIHPTGFGRDLTLDSEFEQVANLLAEGKPDLTDEIARLADRILEFGAERSAYRIVVRVREAGASASQASSQKAVVQKLAKLQLEPNFALFSPPGIAGVDCICGSAKPDP